MMTLDRMLAATPESLLAAALHDLRARGVELVAIYGAGQHTRRAEAALTGAPVTIVGIIDDDPSRHGQRIAGVEIMSAERAAALGARAVVLSSDAAEEALWARSAALRERGIAVVRLYGPTVTAGAGRRGQRVMYWPAFDSEGLLSDHWRRMMWYLAPMLGELEEIVIPVARAGLRPGAAPAFLDPSLDALAALFRPLVRFVDGADDAALRSEAQRCDAVLAWRSESGSQRAISRFTAGAAPATRTVSAYHVDHHRDRRADTAYLHLSEELNPRAREELVQSRAKFARMLASRPWGEVGYVFGTGPSLSRGTAEHDFGDGVAIVCNSMVRNRALMARLRPPIVTVADPIFHAGPSRYAAEFRRHLSDVMHEYGSWLVVPWRDYRLYMAHLDAALRERIIGVPMVNAGQANVNLRARFEVSATSNIFTLFMLPLAATLFREIRVMGCDGRPTAENQYFWKHDPANQIPERMDDAKLAHPSFFNISYDDYYATHCATLGSWIEAAEHGGARVVNLTASYIPALAQRTSAPARAAA